MMCASMNLPTCYYYIDLIRKFFLKDANLESFHILEGGYRFIYVVDKRKLHKSVWWDFRWAIEHSNLRGPYIFFSCSLIRGDFNKISNRWSPDFVNLDTAYISIYNFKKKESEWDILIE